MTNITWEAVALQAMVGIASGFVLFIVSAGLSLIFGVLRVINFAHGSLYMLGAFLATSIAMWLGGAGVGFWGALVFAPLLVALVGVGLEAGLFRRIYAQEHLLQLLLTFGMTLVMADVVRLLWGGEIRRLPLPEALAGSIRLEFLGGRRFRVYDLALVGVGALMALGLWALLYRTRWGRIIRATVDNAEMVGALGMNVDWVYRGVFALGCWLAGLGGVLVAGRSSVALGMDAQMIIQAFAVAVIGGLGNIGGSLLGALLIGVVVSLGTLEPRVAPFAQALPFAVMAIVLIVRPHGLLGKAEQA